MRENARHRPRRPGWRGTVTPGEAAPYPDLMTGSNINCETNFLYRDSKMALFRMYVDEVGNHDLTHADDPNQRFLSLTGVMLESNYARLTFQPELEQLKRDYFQTDPDEPVIFHRKEMVNKKPPFHSLRNAVIEQAFNTELLTSLARWDYTAITVVIDKKAHRDQYATWHFHPYHYCMTVLLERFILFLHYNNHRGDVMVERRGGQEDRKLMDSFQRLFDRGTDNISVQRWQACLTSKELKVKPKSANIAGLQLADLVAHPSRREVLIENGLLVDNRDVFGDQICAILRQSKYNRNLRSGQIEGYGKKLLP